LDDRAKTPVADKAEWQRERERELIAEVLTGNPHRFYDLIAPVERNVYFTAYEILRVPADAEEVAQEAILKAFRNLKQFRGEAKFSTWLLAITANEARLRLRKNREVSLEALKPEDEDGDYTPLELADWREIPGEALVKEELAAHLSDAIAALPLIYREVLVLRDIDGLSILEAAQALEITPANVKTRLLRARLMLRDYFVSCHLISSPMPAGRGQK
jgi:RNA polymerase sigma-70 factor (ECF subfamily)